MSSSNTIVDLTTETEAIVATESVPSPASQPKDEQPASQEQKQKPRFRCPEPGCTRTFNRKYTLSEHSKTHTGEKPHVCPVRTCGKRFTTSGNLSRHKRLHGPMMPIACPVVGCECAFSSDSKLEKHMTFHFGTAEHACVVPGCGKTFSTFGNHNRHMRNQHTREERLLATGRSVGGGSSVGATSPSGSDEWSQSCASNSDDEEGDYELSSPWAAAAGAAAGLPATEPLYNYEPREPWNPEMLEALSLILEEKMVIPDNNLSL
ncbi:Zinc finger protein [Globisporangium polare]